jgi:uncharacterized membrane protein
VGLAAGATVVAALSGWGRPLERPAAAQDAGAARAVAAITSDAPGAAATVPADFEKVVGYRPQAIPSAHGTTVTRESGGCTSPFGPTKYGFGDACKQHDLGYDLLRYAAAKGEPLGPWARRAIDHHFLATMQARCGHAGCLAAAAGYAAVVQVNSWRQGWGTPVVEGLGTLLAPVGAGVVVALLVGSAGLRRRLLALRVSRALRRRLAVAGVRVAHLAEPRTGRILVAAVALAVASQPGVIPRPPWVQAIVAALAAVNAYAVAALAGWATRPLRRRTVHLPRLSWHRARRATSVLLPVTAVAAYAGQVQLSHATGMTPPTVTAQALAVAASAGLAVVATGTLALLAAGARRTARPLAAVALVPLMLFGGPGTASAAAAPGVGAEGRRFLADAPTAAQVAAVTGRPAMAPVRVYVGRDQAATPRARAELAVRELEARHAFDRAVLLVDVPTGSGWVNNTAAGSLEYLYGGDTATVAVQYAASPSWVAYLRGGEGARESVRALVDAVDARVSRLPAHDRPRVVAYGESLGAWGGMTAYPEPGGTRPGTAVLDHVDRALWVGVPAAAPEVAPVPGRLGTLDHPDDPVPAWSPELLVRPSDAWPHPWLPVVTFWQVTGDVIAALGTPAGHGHRYGPELVDEWWQVARPDVADVPTAVTADRLDEVREAVGR